tara:strand:- start:60 stop:554 length:495 start_codon:yes stop_codon:yes gene_type:complete
MIGFAYGLFALGAFVEPLTHGLLIAAVAVVAHATLGLGKKLCPDFPRLTIAILAAAIVLSCPSHLSPVAAIIIGALIGQWLKPAIEPPHPSFLAGQASTRKTVILAALILYALLAALIHPVWTHGIGSWSDLAFASIAFLALYRYKCPAWAVVIGSGIAGFIFY